MKCSECKEEGHHVTVVLCDDCLVKSLKEAKAETLKELKIMDDNFARVSEELRNVKKELLDKVLKTIDKYVNDWDNECTAKEIYKEVKQLGGE